MMSNKPACTSAGIKSQQAQSASVKRDDDDSMTTTPGLGG
jgi:hypothetical protein